MHNVSYGAISAIYLFCNIKQLENINLNSKNIPVKWQKNRNYIATNNTTF